MKIRNVHERTLPAPAAVVGELVDSLSSPDDGLWPRGRWPRLELDAPLGIGAKGGHAFVRYHVVEYDPGRRVEFEFDTPTLRHGRHRFEVEPVAGGHAILRHVLEGSVHGSLIGTWLFVIRPLHDALLEDALDRAEYAVTGTLDRPARWSPWVRLLRTGMQMRAREPIPA